MAHIRLAIRVELIRQPQGEVGHGSVAADPKACNTHADGGWSVRRDGVPHGVEDVALHQLPDEVAHELPNPRIMRSGAYAIRASLRVTDRDHRGAKVEESNPFLAPELIGEDPIAGRWCSGWLVICLSRYSEHDATWGWVDT